MTRILVLFAALAVVVGADRVFAHHSFSATYDSTQKVEIEGVGILANRVTTENGKRG